MKRITVWATLFACMFCAILLQAQPAVLLKGTGSHPESAVTHGNFIYVTDVGKALAPTAKDGDGAIYKLDRSGKVVDLHFNKVPLDAPKGTAIVKNTLYVADIDRIVGIDLRTGEQTDVIDMSAQRSTFLNDVTAKGDSVLFVSATDLGKIFSVGLSKPNRVRTLDLPVIAGANGLVYDAKTNTLYSGSMDQGDTSVGELAAITWSGSRCRYARITDLKGVFDGLVLTDDHTLIVSDWLSLKTLQARVIRVDLRTKTYRVLCEGTDAADIGYDKAAKRLVFPGLRDGDVLTFEVK